MGRITEFSGSWLKPKTSKKKVLNNLQLNGDRSVTRIIVKYCSTYRVSVLPTHACLNVHICSNTQDTFHTKDYSKRQYSPAVKIYNVPFITQINVIFLHYAYPDGSRPMLRSQQSRNTMSFIRNGGQFLYSKELISEAPHMQFLQSSYYSFRNINNTETKHTE